MLGNKKSVLSGVKWTTTSRIFHSLSVIFKISILARYLDKSDFGLMALAMFVIGFMEMFMDMGLTSAILHKQIISRKEYSSLYWLNALFSIAIFITIILLSPYVSHFYNEPNLEDVIIYLAFVILFSALGRQFKTIEQKELNFRFISIVEILSIIFSTIYAILLAYMGYGVLSLVYSTLLQFFISNIIFFVKGIKQFGLLFYFKLVDTKPFIRIGVYQMGSQVINYFNRDLDTIIIGKLFGIETLGIYSLAKQLVFKPMQIVNPIITKVASPMLAKLQNDLVSLKKNYLRLINYVVSINLPIYLMLIFFAPVAVWVVYGEGYEEVVMLVRILSVYMLLRSINNPIGSLVIATGRTDLEFSWNIISLIITPIFISIGVFYSINAVAISMSIGLLVMFVPNWWWLPKRMINVSLKEWVINLIPKWKEIFILLPTILRTK